VVILLGPVGAGKTRALESISADCGVSVVHSRPYSFENADAARSPKPATTVSALTEIAGSLSRGWSGRPRARFHRFTLGWIAAHQHLSSRLHDQSKDALRESIEDLASKSGKAVSTATGVMIDAAEAASVLPGPAASVLKDVLPPLIQALGRRPLRQARRWHSGFPVAEGAPPLDALFELSRLAADNRQDEITAWLMDAFLADVRDNYPRMAKGDPKGSCGCEVPGKGPHWHNWVLLLDDADQPAGVQFLEEITQARQRQAQGPPEDRYDPLLIVAASGRWNRSWQHAWRPPWERGPASPAGPRNVPGCQQASYEDWQVPRAEGQPSPYFPVLIEPLSREQVARTIGIGRYRAECELACRATGGLPGAVMEVIPLIRDRAVVPGERNALAGQAQPGPAPDPWSARLERLRLLEHLPGLSLPELIAAAPFATAPWLVPHDASSLVSHPNLGRILTELRTALWVRDEMHPWLANNLNRALARMTPQPGLLQASYDSGFETLLADQAASAEPARQAYCQLALGKFSDAVDHLVAIFDEVPHREWIAQLSLIARAPDNLPLSQAAWALYEGLVQADGQERATGRPATRNTIARLVAARWVEANEFTMPDRRLRRIVRDCCASLQMQSKRPDVSDLGPDVSDLGF